MVCVVNDYIQVSEVFDLTLEVGLAFFANKIPFRRLSVPGMDVVTRVENDINVSCVVGVLSAIDQRWFIFRPVDAEEPSFRIVSDGFKLSFECFGWWCEINPVSFVALVV